MPARTYVNDNGSWRTIKNLSVNDNGTWRIVKKSWYFDGSVWRQVFDYRTVINITLATSQSSYDMNAAFVAEGWNGVDPVDATITINAGVSIYSTDINNYAFTATALPANSSVVINNYGVITGKGGNGGRGAFSGESNASIVANCRGLPAGPGLFTRTALTIYNYGTIAGGGGGGGGGGWYNYPSGNALGGGGGGGGGSALSPTTGASGYTSGSPGGDTGGAGGAGDRAGGSGGNGGNRGENGGDGGGCFTAGCTRAHSTVPAPGGAYGFAVDGNSFITWAVTGSILVFTTN
jgi:hypothetical protein